MTARARSLLLVCALVLVALAISVIFSTFRTEVWRGIVDLLHQVQALSATSPALAAAFYVLVFAVLVACCVPLGPAMSLVGGVAFGALAGTACALLAILLGCSACFLAVRAGFGQSLQNTRGTVLQPLQQRLGQDGFWALLALRVAPVMPSWLLNIAAGLGGMRLLPFAGATVLGVLPATTLYATTGAGLGAGLDGQTPAVLDMLMRPQVLLPLLGLSALALVPVLLRALRTQ